MYIEVIHERLSRGEEGERREEIGEKREEREEKREEREEKREERENGLWKAIHLHKDMHPGPKFAKIKKRYIQTLWKRKGISFSNH